MSYFTAVLVAPRPVAGAPHGVPAPLRWRALEVDLDEVSNVDDLADALADAETDEAGEGGVALAVLEREDEWFALVRAAEGGVRVFVSDLEASARSRFAALLEEAASSAPSGGPGRSGHDGEPDEGSEDDDEGSNGEGDDDADAPEDRNAGVAEPSWAGDAALLGDLGVGSDELVRTSEGNDPAGALALVGERLGFVDQLEALR